MSVSVIIDISLVIILAVCAVVGWKKGLIRTLRGFLSYIVSFAVANATYRFLSVYVIKLPFLQGLITDIPMPPVAEDATFMDKISVAFRYIAENAKLTSLGTSADEAKLIFNNYIAEALADIISFIVVFFAVTLLLKLLLWIFDKIASNTPIIREANSLLGAIVGLFKGLFWTWAVTNLFVRFLLPILCEKLPTVFTPEIANSFAINLCTKINPITYLLLLINMITN